MGLPVEVKACGWYEKWEPLQALLLDQGKDKSKFIQRGNGGIALLFL